LREGSVTVNSNAFTISVPALSTTAVLLSETSSDTTVTGILEFNQEDNDVRIYPNPVSDFLTVSVKSKTTEPIEIMLLDQSGRMLRNMTYHGHSLIIIDISDIPNGLYLLSINQSNSQSIYRFTIAR
jgi:Secretion system C-terminal sorting domain